MNRIIAVFSCLLLLSFRMPRPGDYPPEIKEQLLQLRLKDRLTDWIYARIQYTAVAPGSRADLLVRTQDEAWRVPRSNEEIQAWMDLFSNEGYALLAKGDIVRSTDLYTEAFDWARQHTDIADPALVLDNILKPLGNNYTRLGDYEQALYIQRKALTIAFLLGDKDQLAGVYANLANAAGNMGLPKDALGYCKKGLAIVDSHSAFCGLLLSEQADAYEQLTLPQQARESIMESILRLERLSGRGASGSEGNRQAESGLEKRRGQTEGGRQAGGARQMEDEEALGGLWADRNADYWLLSAYQQAGDIYRKTAGGTETALGFYRRALALQQRLDLGQGGTRQRDRAKLFQRLGALYAGEGRTDSAELWLGRCLAMLLPGREVTTLKEQDLYGENTLMDLLHVQAGVFRQLGKTDEALRAYVLCFATEGKLRKELVSASAKESSVADSRMRYEEAIGFAWDVWKRTADHTYREAILHFIESSKAQLLLEEEAQEQRLRLAGGMDSIASRVRLLLRAKIYYERVAEQAGREDSTFDVATRQVKQISWDLAKMQRREAGSLSGRPDTGRGTEKLSTTTAALSVLLADGRKLRTYFAGVNAIYEVECSKEGIDYAEKLPLSSQWQDSVRHWIGTYFGQGPDAMINHPNGYYRRAYEIYHALFGLHPLLEHERYQFLLDGALDRLPLEALVTDSAYSSSPAQWPFLIRKISLSYGWSIRTLYQAIVQEGTRGGKAEEEKTFSGFFLSHSKGGDRPLSPELSAVAAEEAGIRGVLKEGNWYMDEQATGAAFRNAIPHTSILHISSHAFARQDSSGVPYIRLYDEPFYLFELPEMASQPTLVVLSACRTGDGRIVTGEGLQSLARGFSAGGAKAVIAGWWNVNDETTSGIVRGFYSDLKRDPEAGAAEALRSAKLGWLDDPDVSYLYKLPYYWCALNYQGSPDPLNEGVGMDNRAMALIRKGWWLVVLLVVIGFFFVAKRRRRI